MIELSERVGHEQETIMIIGRSQVTATVGKLPEATAAVVAARDAASAVTGLSWSAWTALAGAPYGSLALTARTENLEQVAEILVALGGNAEWQKVAAGFSGLITGPADVAFDEIIHVAGDPERSKAFGVITEARLAPGQATAGYAWSAKAADFVHKVTGVSGQVATSVAGPMFNISWLNALDTMSEVDDFNAALAAEPGYFSLLDEAAGLFVDAPANRSIAMRLP